MAAHSTFTQTIVCDTQDDYDAALAQLQAYDPAPDQLTVTAIEEFLADKRLVATFEQQVIEV